MSADAVLAIEELRIGFRGADGISEVVRGVGISVMAGEVVALVGESGSGKSMTALGVMQLLPRGARIVSGSIRLNGSELVGLSDAQVAARRGRDMAMIFQDPLSALNPAFTIGRQLTDAIHAHQRIGQRAAIERAAELLAMVGIAAPRARLNAYAHEFSGGMRQRVAIALAVACEPRLLIADEPTTALDVTVQGQVMALLRRLRRDTGIAILFISHNLDLVAEICDRVVVMYAGRVVETGEVDRLFGNPRHPYTRQLLRCIPRLSASAGPLPTIPGEPPRSGAMLPGCAFAPRCDRAFAPCAQADPALLEEADQGVACWLAA